MEDIVLHVSVKCCQAKDFEEAMQKRFVMIPDDAVTTVPTNPVATIPMEDQEEVSFLYVLYSPRMENPPTPEQLRAKLRGVYLYLLTLGDQVTDQEFEVEEEDGRKTLRRAIALAKRRATLATKRANEVAYEDVFRVNPGSEVCTDRRTLEVAGQVWVEHMDIGYQEQIAFGELFAVLYERKVQRLLAEENASKPG